MTAEAAEPFREVCFACGPDTAIELWDGAS